MISFSVSVSVSVSVTPFAVEEYITLGDLLSNVKEDQLKNFATGKGQKLAPKTKKEKRADNKIQYSV